MGISAQTRSPTKPTTPQKLSINELSRYERAVRIIKFYETFHKPKDKPYIGYGHRLQRGEKLSSNISRKQADSLLRSDLNKMIHYFKDYGDKALLLSVLAYNVGLKPIVGGKGKPESKLLQKIKRGDDNIEAEYLGFCQWNGRKITSIKRRRWTELKLLYYS